MLQTAFADLETALRPSGDPSGVLIDDLATAAERASTLVDLVRTLASETHAGHDSDLVYWVEAARRTIDSWRSDLLAERRAP